MNHDFLQMTQDTITSKEIMELLGISKAGLSVLKNDLSSGMPEPVNQDKKKYLYDRKQMLAWINEHLQKQDKPRHGLDNKMAKDFLRQVFDRH